MAADPRRFPDPSVPPARPQNAPEALLGNGALTPLQSAALAELHFAEEKKKADERAAAAKRVLDASIETKKAEDERARKRAEQEAAIKRASETQARIDAMKRTLKDRNDPDLQKQLAEAKKNSEVDLTGDKEILAALEASKNVKSMTDDELLKSVLAASNEERTAAEMESKILALSLMEADAQKAKEEQAQIAALKEFEALAAERAKSKAKQPSASKVNAPNAASVSANAASASAKPKPNQVSAAASAKNDGRDVKTAMDVKRPEPGNLVYERPDNASAAQEAAANASANSVVPSTRPVGIPPSAQSLLSDEMANLAAAMDKFENVVLGGPAKQKNDPKQDLSYEKSGAEKDALEMLAQNDGSLGINQLMDPPNHATPSGDHRDNKHSKEALLIETNSVLNPAASAAAGNPSASKAVAKTVPAGSGSGISISPVKAPNKTVSSSNSATTSASVSSAKHKPAGKALIPQFSEAQRKAAAERAAAQRAAAEKARAAANATKGKKMKIVNGEITWV